MYASIPQKRQKNEEATATYGVFESNFMNKILDSILNTEKQCRELTQQLAASRVEVEGLKRKLAEESDNYNDTVVGMASIVQSLQRQVESLRENDAPSITEERVREIYTLESSKWQGKDDIEKRLNEMQVQATWKDARIRALEKDVNEQKAKRRVADREKKDIVNKCISLNKEKNELSDRIRTLLEEMKKAHAYALQCKKERDAEKKKLVRRFIRFLEEKKIELTSIAVAKEVNGREFLRESLDAQQNDMHELDRLRRTGS